MDLDRVALVSFDRAVRRRIRRLDFQFLWWGLLRRREQSKDEKGQQL